METHMEVIAWMRPGHPPRGNVTVMREGTTEQSGRIISGTWLSGEALTGGELHELETWARTYWDMPGR